MSTKRLLEKVEHKEGLIISSDMVSEKDVVTFEVSNTDYSSCFIPKWDGCNRQLDSNSSLIKVVNVGGPGHLQCFN